MLGDADFNFTNGSSVISEVKSPIAVLGAEVDRLSPPELVKQFEEILNGKTEVLIIEELTHILLMNVVVYIIPVQSQDSN